MSESSNTTVLITGANRGLGLGFAEVYLSRPNNTVIAAVRNPSNYESMASLNELPIGAVSKLILVKIDSLSETDAADAVKMLQTKHDIMSLDVVVANSGICTYMGPAVSAPISLLRRHFEVNTFGPLILFQATAALLEASKSEEGKFCVMSSAAGSITAHYPAQNIVYGTTKAAVNFITRKIHHEHPNIIAIAFSPGWVRTDMGNDSADQMGLPRPTLAVQASVAAMIGQVGRAHSANLTLAVDQAQILRLIQRQRPRLPAHS